MPGSMPFMPRIIFCRPPFATIFIIFCVCSNCFSSWLTSCTLTPGAGRDAPLARRLEELGLRALGRRHRVDDALDARRCDARRRSRPAPRARAPPAACRAMPARPPILRICAICVLEVGEVEALARLDLLRELLRLVDVDVLAAPPRSATARRPCRGCARPCARDGTPRGRRSSRHAGELDRRAGDVAHRQRRAAARIAVELGQDDAGQRQRVAERLARC